MFDLKLSSLVTIWVFKPSLKISKSLPSPNINLELSTNLKLLSDLSQYADLATPVFPQNSASFLNVAIPVTTKPSRVRFVIPSNVSA